MKILIVHPSKGRPKKAIERIFEHLENASKLDFSIFINYVLSVSLEDITEYVESIEHFKKVCAEKYKISRLENIIGYSIKTDKMVFEVSIASEAELNTCVKATNFPFISGIVDATDFDFTIINSDDMILSGNLYEILKSNINKENLGALQVHDGITDAILTFPILTKKWMQQAKHIYYHEYISMFADNDLKSTLIHAGYDVLNIGHGLVEHKHYVNRKAEQDEHYKRQNSDESWFLGKKIYEERRLKNFPVWE